jgi:hypothetical protein
LDLTKLTTADKIIIGSGLLLFIAYFLDWFTAEAGGFTASISGGDVGFLWATLPMLIGLVMAGVVIASKLFDVKLPELSFPWGLIHLALGGLAALLVILKLLIGEDADGAEALGVDVSRGIGIFLATLAAIGLAAGGFLMFQGEGGTKNAAGGNTGTAPF